MDFLYRIAGVNREERWIFISSNDDDTSETDSFIFLIKSIAAQNKGKIKAVGDIQYAIENDPLGLIYQWDSLYGITVIYPFSARLEQVCDFFAGLSYFNREKSPPS